MERENAIGVYRFGLFVFLWQQGISCKEGEKAGEKEQAWESLNRELKASERSRELQQFLIVVEILAFADYGVW